MLIDCDTCPVRGTRCGDCMVVHLGPIRYTDPPEQTLGRLQPAERSALEIFAAHGLIHPAAIDEVELEVDPRLRSVG
ncbi:hypothetical protein [Calidifontibacter terrae]